MEWETSIAQSEGEVETCERWCEVQLAEVDVGDHRRRGLPAQGGAGGQQQQVHPQLPHRHQDHPLHGIQSYTIFNRTE